jgi:hypothetical protein
VEQPKIIEAKPLLKAHSHSCRTYMVGTVNPCFEQKKQKQDKNSRKIAKLFLLKIRLIFKCELQYFLAS